VARSLKDIRRRIASIKKTRQITRAMKLVAGARLKRATDAAVSARPFARHLTEVLGRVAASAAGSSASPLLAPPKQVRRVALVLLTSDRGLCGGFNNTLARRTAEWIARKRESGVEVEIWVMGKKGVAAANTRRWTATRTVVDWTGTRRREEVLGALLTDAVDGFVAGAVDEVWLAYNSFVSVLTQRPTYHRLLPATVESAGAAAGEYRTEPSAAEILDALLPLYVRTTLLQAFLETEAGEHAARMTAMDSATRNAGRLIDKLTLEYNRARQAAITKELIEIVSGAEAL
jgi:F-type H+-transporting ATPase subunit gamma